MKLRTLFAAIIYLGSYLPLSVILLAQDADAKRLGRPLCANIFSAQCELPLTHPLIALAVVGVCVVSFGITLIVLSNIRATQPIKIQDSKPIPADLMNYVLPYVVAFMTLNYDDIPKLAGFIVFFVWIFVITHSSGRVMMNPVLAVFGWHLYEISYNFVGADKVRKAVVLSRVELSPGTTYRHASIEDVMIVKEEM